MRRDTRRARHQRTKKKGFILSFGDIILPFVGVLAIGLLVIAGKLFFVNGFQPSPSIASTQEQAVDGEKSEAGSGTAPVADAADPVPLSPEAQDGLSTAVGASAQQTQQKRPMDLDILAIPYGSTTAVPLPTDGGASKGDADPSLKVARTPVKPATGGEAQAEKKEQASAKGKVVSVKSGSQQKPAQKPTPAKAEPKPAQKAQPAKPAAVQKPAQKAQPAKQAAAQKQNPWRVQVGAYGSKAAASEIVSKLAKSGYTASVFSGPRFHKVWVQAGTTKQSADAMMARLRNAGFPESYVVPPAQR